MLPIAGKDEQKSTTYAAIVDGKLVVTGNKDFKEEEVNRNTENTLNALANTLDTQKIAERKRLAELFAKNAFEQVHKLSDEMKLEEGSAGKVVLHAVVAGLTAKLGGDNFAAGSMAGAVNEIMNGAISRYEKAHPGKGLTPAEHQWISAAVGAIVNSATGSTIQTGMADAVYATKWNYQLEDRFKDYNEKAEKARKDGDTEKAEYYDLKNQCENDLSEKALNDYIKNTLANIDATDNSPKELKIVGIGTDGKNYRAVINVSDEVIKEISKQASEKADSLCGKDFEEYLSKKQKGELSDSSVYNGNQGLGLSIELNIIAGKIDSNIDLVNTSLKKNGYKSIKYTKGVAGKVLTAMAFYDDYHKYSGVNLCLAWSIDGGVTYGVGKIAAVATGAVAAGITGNPFLGMGVTAGAGFISDGLSNVLKDWLLVQDHKEIKQTNK